MNDRHAAAEHLRHARRLLAAGTHALDEAAEAAAWSRCAWPESIVARRLEARLALLLGDAPQADTLIAQGLLLKPNDPGLTRLLAARQVSRGRIAEARRLVDDLLTRSPEHAGTLLLAADIAAALGQYPREIELIERILPRRSEDAALHRRLAEAHLHADQIDEAERLASLLRPRDRVLEARCYLERGRLPDAAALLEAAEREMQLDEEGVILLIDVLESIGDGPRLRTRLDMIDATRPRALLRAARARLLLGDFERIRKDLASLMNTSADRSEAAGLLTAACWGLGRFDAARTWFTRYRDEGRSNPQTFAEIWRRALWGRLRQTHINPAHAGGDPDVSPLNRLLRSALAVFSDDLRRQPDDPEALLALDRCRALLPNTTAPIPAH